MPAVSLSCRVCSAEHPLEANGTCTRCFGPLDPVYDWDALRASVTRERLAAGPPSIWRYADLLPVTAPTEPRLSPGWTPLVPAPRLAEAVGVRELWLKLDTANPTHSFKDRVVAVAARKAQELGLGRSPARPRATSPARSRRAQPPKGLEAAVFCPADLEPEKLAAAAVYGPTVYAVDGTYDHCSRLSVELSFELDWGFVNVNLRAYYAEGSKTLAYEVVEQLGWQLPDVIAIPIASGALFHKVGQGLGELRALGLVDGETPKLIGGQAEGCAPVATAFASGGACSPCGPRRSVARSRSATPPTATSLSRPRGRRAARSTQSRNRQSVRTWSSSPARAVSSARPRPASRSARSATAVAAGEIEADARVVLLVTGDGLKTPQAVAHTFAPVRISADADEFVEHVLVA